MDGAQEDNARMDDPPMDMIEVPMRDLRGRVLVSTERVKFTDADPYGHLASGAYVDMIMSHRVQVLEELVGFSILDHARSGVAFPARTVTVSYVRPALVGEVLELGSWVEELDASSFEVRAVVAGAADRRVRAFAAIRFVTVDVRTGRRLTTPETLPSAAKSNPVVGLRTAATWRNSVSGLPEEWMPQG
jgi:YbgC/YbaW family acyl-CoA thioester hydrolase